MVKIIIEDLETNKDYETKNEVRGMRNKDDKVTIKENEILEIWKKHYFQKFKQRQNQEE